MAIRREYRRFYGADWRAYRAVLIAIARNRCANCGHVLPSRQLAAAHITHDPRSSEVRVLCFACHARHDARHRIAVRRRNWARRYGQAWLWPELAWDAWLVPRRLIDAALRAAQERLF